MESLVDIELKVYGDGPQVEAMRVKLAAATAEVDRILHAADPTGSIAAMQSLQADHDRYLAQLGPDNAIVKGLRAQLDAATELASPTAAAVELAALVMAGRSK